MILWVFSNLNDCSLNDSVILRVYIKSNLYDDLKICIKIIFF